MSYILIELECQTEGCDFVTLSLTTAREHLFTTRAFGGEVHNIELRGYLKSDPISMVSAEEQAVSHSPMLDPQPWLFISDQVFGEHRSDHDKGRNPISGTYWAFRPREGYEQDPSEYTAPNAGSDVPPGDSEARTSDHYPGRGGW